MYMLTVALVKKGGGTNYCDGVIFWRADVNYLVYKHACFFKLPPAGLSVSLSLSMQLPE